MTGKATADVQAVEAEVIEYAGLAKAPEPAVIYTLPTAKITNLEAVEKYVEAVEGFFADVKIDVTDAEQVKQLSKMRADINKVANVINKKRIAMDKEVKASIAEADGALNGLRDRVKAVYDATGKQIAEAEELRLEGRVKLLEREYEAQAPDLMELIPLSAFTSREIKLLQKSWTGKTACDRLGDMVAKVVAERKTLEGLEFAVEADRVYCRTLDAAAALAENARLVKEREDREAHAAKAADLAAKVSARAEPAPSVLDAAMERAEGAVKAASAPEPKEAVFEWEMKIRATKPQAMKIKDYVKEIGAVGLSLKGVLSDG